MKNRLLFRWIVRAALGALCCALGVAVYRSREAPVQIEDQQAATPQVHNDPRHDRNTPSSPSGDEWVGSRKCAECHGEIWEKYQGHPMARSSAPVSDPSQIEDYTDHVSFSQPESRTYRVERRNNQVLHHEMMTDQAGDAIYDQAVEVHLALGSGKRGRSYVIDRDGVLYQSPISWYTKANRWDLSPGYRPRTHQRFDRRVAGSCLHCHVGRVAGLPDSPDRFQSPPVLEYSIGCERCHGPGGEHVRFHEQGAESAGGTGDQIVRPAKLEVAPREDVCNQCHLQGHRILRNGREDYDFRPGQRLEEIWTIFPKEERDEDASSQSLRAVGQVEQMRESVCYQKSEGRMGCTSCHDPHSVPAEDRKLEYFTQRCLSCHETQGCSAPVEIRNAPPANGACTICHMPALSARDVPHTAQTNHRIVRHVDSVRPHPDHTPLALFDDADSRLPAYDVKRGRALHLMERLLKKPDSKGAAQLEGSLREVLAETPDDVDVLQHLGSVCMMQNRPHEAEALWRRLLQLRPEHEGALLRMAILERERGNLPDALELMRRYAQINPWLAEFHASLAQVLWQSGDVEEALATARHGLELDPRMLPIRKWLAAALRQSGDAEGAKEQLRILERMQGR